MYDYILVGAGLYNAVLAHGLTKEGKRCLVLEKRRQIGGNLYTETFENIHVHKYGAHIFHTNKKHIWDYVQQFATFNHFINSPIANYNGELYNLPFNMNTFYQMWGVIKPEDAKLKIKEQQSESKEEPNNLEEQAIRLVGKDIYLKLIKYYTQKQWGRACTELPASIIRRLPVRYTFDNNYFSDPYQGIPKGGYTVMIQKMLEGIEVRLDTDFLIDKEVWMDQGKKIIFTGTIDSYYDYCYGALEYRSVEFEEALIKDTNYQGVAVMNFTDEETPYTRIIEHKHFDYEGQPHTVISKEFSREWKVGIDPYYPINDEKNSQLFGLYKELADKEDKVMFGGRLGEYKYYDMDKVIESALEQLEKELNR